MARRRYRMTGGGSARSKKLGNAPSPPIEIKAAKLNFTGLAQAYDWATIDQVFGMRLAFDWYNENAPILLAMDPPDAIRQKTYERAVKAQKLGEGTSIIEEQKQAFTTALHLFEKLWTPKQPALPLVNPALTPDAKPSKSLAWQQTLLEAFKVFQPFGLTYVPALEMERGLFAGDGMDNSNQAVHIPVAELAQMRGSVLSVLLKEAVEVAKQTSITEVDGVPQLDGSIFLTTLPKVLEAVATTAGGKSAVAPTLQRVHASTGSRTDSSQRKTAIAASAGVQLNDEAVIHLLNPSGINKYKGLNAIRFSVIRDGMTLREYRSAVVGKIEAKRCGTAYIRDFFTLTVRAGHVSFSGS